MHHLLTCPRSVLVPFAFCYLKYNLGNDMPLVLCFQLYCFLNEFFWSVPRIFPKKTWPSLGHGQGVLVTYISDVGVDIVVKNLQYMMQYNETIHFFIKIDTCCI